MVRLPRHRRLPLARPAGDLTALLRRLRPDVVHLASPAVLGPAAARSAGTLGVPSVAVSRTTWPPLRARPSVDGRTWGRVGDELIGHLRRVRTPGAA